MWTLMINDVVPWLDPFEKKALFILTRLNFFLNGANDHRSSMQSMLMQCVCSQTYCTIFDFRKKISRANWKKQQRYYYTLSVGEWNLHPSPSPWLRLKPTAAVVGSWIVNDVHNTGQFFPPWKKFITSKQVRKIKKIFGPNPLTLFKWNRHDFLLSLVAFLGTINFGKNRERDN